MRPESEVPGKARGSRRKVRRLLDFELGWLRGYPDGRRSGSGAEAEVGWVERSRPGRSGVARMVSRSDLQKAKRHIQALTRDFPRALPAVVGDAVEWRAGVDWLLGRLGQWLRGDAEVARWWRFDEVFEVRPMSARDRRTVREVVASRPALADLAATLLCGGHEAEDRRADLLILRRHADVLERIGASLGLDRTHDLLTVLGCLPPKQAREFAAAVAAELVEPPCDAPAWPEWLREASALQADVDRLAEQLRERAQRGERSALWPLAACRGAAVGARAEAVAGVIRSILDAEPGAQRWLARLFTALCPSPELRRSWLRFDAAWTAATRDAQRLVDGVGRALKGRSGRRVVRAAAKRLIGALADRPAALPMPRIGALIDVCARSSLGPESLRRFVAAVEDLPAAGEAQSLRLELAGKWLELSRHVDLAAFSHVVEAAARAFRAVDPALLRWWWRASDIVRCLWPETVLVDARTRVKPSRALAVITAGLAGTKQPERHDHHFHWHNWVEVAAGIPDDRAAGTWIREYVTRCPLDKAMYLTAGHVEVAYRISDGDPVRGIESLLLFGDELADFEDSAAFRLIARRDDLARLVGLAMRIGNKRMLKQLVFDLQALLKLGSRVPAIRFRPKHRAGDKRSWMRRFPQRYRQTLVELDATLDGADEIADRILGRAYPDGAAIRREIRALRALCDAAPASRRAGMQRRLAALESRIERPEVVSERRADNLQRDLDERLARAQLAEAHRLLLRFTARSRSRFAAGLGIPVDPALDGLITRLAGLRPAFRDVAWELLRRRAARDPARPVDLRDLPQNQAFLAGLRHSGVDVTAWLEGLPPVEFEGPDGERLVMAMASDPVDYFRMGEPFGTCLRPDGENFFSTVANAADINKRVLMVWDAKGEIRARCLFALTTRGGIVTHHPYSHSDKLAFRKRAAGYAARLAKAMGSVVVMPHYGELKALVLPDWYDDGAEDLIGAFDCFADGSALRRTLVSADPADIPALVEEGVAPHPMSDVVLQHLIALPELRSAPERLASLTASIERSGSLRTRLRAVAFLYRRAAFDAARQLADPVLRDRRQWRSLDESDAVGLAKLMLPDRPLVVVALLRACMARSKWIRGDEHAQLQLARAYLLLGRRRRAREIVARLRRSEQDWGRSFDAELTEFERGLEDSAR